MTTGALTNFVPGWSGVSAPRETRVATSRATAGLAGCGVPGDDGELAHGDAVGPEPVGGLGNEEFVRVKAELGCAGGCQEGGLEGKPTPREGIVDLLRGASGGAGEGETEAGFIADAEGGDVRMRVHGAVEAVRRRRGAATVRVAAAEGASYAPDVGFFLRGERGCCHTPMIPGVGAMTEGADGRGSAVVRQAPVSIGGFVRTIRVGW